MHFLVASGIIEPAWHLVHPRLRQVETANVRVERAVVRPN
jgi:hypothetical protein